MMNLSKPQTAIFEMDRFGGGNIAGIAGDIFFNKEVNVDHTADAVNMLLRDCDILRTRIVMNGETPMQIVTEYEHEVIETIAFDNEAEYKKWAQTQAEQTIDIFGKLYSFTVVTVGEKVGIFLNMHHIIGDAWTMGILGERLCEYVSLGEAKPICPYSAYIEAEKTYEQSKKRQKDESFWLEIFDNNPECSYLSEKQADTNAADRKEFVFSAEQSRAIKACCNENETSEFAVFFAAVSAYFYRVTGKNDFYIGTPVLNRSTLDEKNTAGTFINTIPLSVHIDDSDTFSMLCGNIGDSVSSAFRHQKYLYSDLLKLLRAERKFGETLFDVMVSFQNMQLSGDAILSWYHCGSQTESLQVHIDDRNNDGVYHIDYDYQTDKFTAKEISRLHEHICNLLFEEIGAEELKDSCDIAESEDVATAEGVDITIGKPIANTQIYILDNRQKPVPIGITGELCIAGDGVGAGYLNRPELTAEKFVPNPFGEGKMYKTGDLAYWREDGNIMYVGRNDFQVKIRGLRIELGEIENAISAVDGVSQAVVVVRKNSEGRQLICAFYTTNVGNGLDHSAIRAQISKKLPKYMLPHIFTYLDKMPMTSSGKINRNALPEIDLESISSAAEYVAPVTETEKLLCSIIAETLKTEKVSITDDFFELGGDSLVAISLTNRLESLFGVRVDMKDIFENSVIKSLAGFIDTLEKCFASIPTLGKDEYVLTPQQLAIYAACKKDSDSLVYNMPMKIDASGLDKSKLKEALSALYRSHKAFKTVIAETEDGVKAVVDRNAEFRVEVVDDINDFVKPFDLSEAPLFRAAFCGDSLLIDTHHIVCDGQSVSVLIDELSRLYDGAEPVTEKVWYGDYAEYFKAELSSGAFEEHFGFYKSMLTEELEPVTLPEKRHKVEHGIGRSENYSIDDALFEKEKRRAKSLGISNTALFLGAYGILLSKYSASEEILTGVIMTNRTHAETENTVGMFVNTLPVLLEPTGTKDIVTYLRDTNSKLLSLSKYQELPFTAIAGATGFEKSKVNNSFVYQASGKKRIIFGDKAVLSEAIPTNTAKFDLTFELTPSESGCEMRIEFDDSKLDASLVGRLAESYIMILEQVCAG